jgi:hypothetical protein
MQVVFSTNLEASLKRFFRGALDVLCMLCLFGHGYLLISKIQFLVFV